jgi:hypothetical protein
MKADAKLDELGPLTQKFAKQSRVGNFRNERTRSTPLDPKLMFWGVSDSFAKQSCFGIFCNGRTRSTPFDPKLMFWGVSDRFGTA